MAINTFSMRKHRFKGLLWLVLLFVMMIPVASAACQQASPTEWWDNSWDDRVEVNLTEPGAIARTDTPTNVELSFTGTDAHENSLRVTCFDGSSWTELDSQNWDVTTSGTSLRDVKVAFLADVSNGATSTYYVYYDNNDPGAASYSTSWGSVTDDGQSVTLDNAEVSTEWSYDDGNFTRGVSIYDKAKSLEWLKEYNPGQGVPHSGWVTRIDDTAGHKFKAFKRAGLVQYTVDGAVFKEAQVRTKVMNVGGKKLRAYYTVRVYKGQREFERVLSIEGRNNNNFIEDANSRIQIPVAGNGGDRADAYVWEGANVTFDDNDGVHTSPVADSSATSNFFALYGTSSGEGSLGMVWQSSTDNDDMYRVELDEERETGPDERDRLESNELLGVSIELDKGDFWHHDGIWVVLGDEGSAAAQQDRATELGNPLTIGTDQ